MNCEKSEIRDQRSEQNSQLSTLNSAKGRGPNGALRPQPSIELHIEELVLHGFASRDRNIIAHAVERELAWLFGEQGVPVALRSQNETDETIGATFKAARNTNPSVVGLQIAQAVYEGFSE
jgi:hypothetical protein